MLLAIVHAIHAALTSILNDQSLFSASIESFIPIFLRDEH
jgi:hypothetical protein